MELEHQVKGFKMKTALYLFSAVVAICSTGCVAPGPSRGYIDSNEDVFGQASRMEYTQKHRSIDDILAKMKTDPLFTEKYGEATERAKMANRKRPTVAIMPIENNTGDNMSDSATTGQMYRELITALRKTGLFEIIDYARRAQMKDTVVSAVDGGENSSNLQHIGGYTSADFIMTGELRREHTDDRYRNVYHHFLNLEMTDTSTGDIFWSDTATPTAKFGIK